MEYKFFEIIPSGTNLDFVGKSKWFLGLSAVFLTAGMISLAVKGLNYGVDFQGGTQVHVKFKKTTEVSDIRKSLDAVKLNDAAVQGFGEANSQEYLIRVLPQKLNLESKKAEFQKALDDLFPGKPARVRYSEERIYVVLADTIEPSRILETLKPFSTAEINAETAESFGQADNHEYVVKFSGASTKITEALTQSFGVGSFETLQIEQVGAKVGGKLRMQAIGAIIISILLILLYVWVRFDLEFAPGAVAALIHDALVVLSVFSLFNLQFDLSIVAAVLTIIGYSINDTIVIYDRIRENRGKSKVFDMLALINTSLNETLGRTILTSTTLLLAALALLFVGGPITYNFALAFVVGIISGSYSTLYIATPLTVYFYNYLQRTRKVVA